MIHIIRNDSWNDGGGEDLRILYSIRGSTSTGVFVWRGNRRRIAQGEAFRSHVRTCPALLTALVKVL